MEDLGTGLEIVGVGILGVFINLLALMLVIKGIGLVGQWNKDKAKAASGKK